MPEFLQPDPTPQSKTTGQGPPAASSASGVYSDLILLYYQQLCPQEQAMFAAKIFEGVSEAFKLGLGKGRDD